MGMAISESRVDHRNSGADFRTLMMTPPTIAHNRIAVISIGGSTQPWTSTTHRCSAAQRPGLQLASGDYKPEPDVGVIDSDFSTGQRFVEKAYLLAEIVSGTDDIPVPGTNRRWVDVKRDLYRAHQHCQTVLIVSQDHMEVEPDIKTDNGWAASVLKGGGAELSIPAFGFRCFVADLSTTRPRWRRARLHSAGRGRSARHKDLKGNFGRITLTARRITEHR